MPQIRILLAEDHRDRPLLLALARGRPRLDVCVAATEAELDAAIEDQRFDCLIVDGAFAGNTGAALLARHAGRACPILVGAGSAGAETISRGAALAGDALWELVEHAIVESRRTRSERHTAERRGRRIVRTAERDALTGLCNRRHLEHLIGVDRLRQDRPAPMSCLLLDVDGLAGVNGTHGDGVGDRVLRAVADAIGGILGDAGHAVRWGEDEFAVLRPSPSPTEAWLWAERLRRAVERAGVQAGGARVLPTVSVGIACFAGFHRAEEMLNRADHALYLAKDHGRNRVCTWDMVVVERIAEGIEAIPGLTSEQRRDEFFRRLSRRLGPTQLDHLTSHSERVSTTANRLAALLHMGPEDAERVRVAGLLHDIGKSMIPDDLLGAPRTLTAEERDLMDRHAEASAEISVLFGVDEATEGFIRHHHTRFDSAYTARLGLPLGARVLSVADALVTMTTDRPYSAARAVADALGELRAQRGRQFDPIVVAAAHRLAPEELSAAA